VHTGTRVKVKEIDNESSIPWKTVESIHPERSTSTCGQGHNPFLILTL